jgi:hypothetical protein
MNYHNYSVSSDERCRSSDQDHIFPMKSKIMNHGKKDSLVLNHEWPDTLKFLEGQI